MFRNFGEYVGVLGVREFIARPFGWPRTLDTNTVPFGTNFRKACNEKYTQGANNRALSGVHQIRVKARDVLEVQLTASRLTRRRRASLWQPIETL
jgi:hypothetical protein